MPDRSQICRSALVELEEQVAYEGPHTIAAIMLEPVTGTNGILPPPQGYLEGVQSLCREHGILFICDEVMSGFGRTGKLFGFCHGPSVVPDIFTFAKVGCLLHISVTPCSHTLTHLASGPARLPAGRERRLPTIGRRRRARPRCRALPQEQRMHPGRARL